LAGADPFSFGDPESVIALERTLGVLTCITGSSGITGD
jgi:hypothetical protein